MLRTSPSNMQQKAQEGAVCSGANLPTLRRNELRITEWSNVNICHATRRHKPDDWNLLGHRCEKLRNASICATGCSKIFFHGQNVVLGARRAAYRILVGNPEKRDLLEDLGVGGRIILEWIFEKSVGMAWTALICLRRGTKWWAVVNAEMNFYFPYNDRKFLTSWEIVSFSKKILLYGFCYLIGQCV